MRLILPVSVADWCIYPVRQSQERHQSELAARSAVTWHSVISKTSKTAKITKGDIIQQHIDTQSV